MFNSTSKAIIPYTTQQNQIEFTQPQPRISSLPTELTLYIFTFLNSKSLLNCSLVCKDWKMLSSEKSLWLAIFKNEDFSKLKTSNSCISEAWLYRDIGSIFIKSDRFGAAIAASTVCAEKDAYTGAYALRDVCKTLCKASEYVLAVKCQQLSKRYYADAGNEAMSHIIISRANELNFLEIADILTQDAIELIDEDREYGLQSLMEIAKKYAELGFSEKAMQITQQARELRDSRGCDRGRNHSDDIHPFVVMGKHMLTLNQYELAEICAEKLDKKYFHPEWLYSDIIIKQIENENFKNTPLISKLKPETMSYITAYEGLIFGLIKNGRIEEAKDIAKQYLAMKWTFNKDRFIANLTKELSSIGVNSATWLES